MNLVRVSCFPIKGLPTVFCTLVSFCLLLLTFLCTYPYYYTHFPSVSLPSVPVVVFAF
jgi:hypothetical protein